MHWRIVVAGALAVMAIAVDFYSAVLSIAADLTLISLAAICLYPLLLKKEEA